MAPIVLLTLGLLAGAFAAPFSTPVLPEPSCNNGVDNGKTFVTDNTHWKIECSLTYLGGDIAISTLNSFSKCIKACDAIPECVAVSYVGDQCYQKGTITETSTEQANYWTARHFRTGEESLVVARDDDPEHEYFVPIGVHGPDEEEEPIPVEDPEEELVVPFSCLDKKDDGKLYRTMKGVFKVVCGKDFGGNDISATNAESFEACIETCSATTGCVNIAYVWGSCYLKSKSGDTSDVAHVWSAKLQTEDPVEQQPTIIELTCVDNKDNGRDFTTPKGTYHIQCGTDFAGNDIGAAQAVNFEACLTECSQTTGCNTVSFVYGSCYMKSKKGDAVAVAHVWGASLVTIVPEINALSCVDKKDDAKVYDSPSGGTYLISCAIDYEDGDYSSSVVSNFEACITACDNEAQCIDLSYVEGSCYLKNVQTPALVKNHVWSAKLVAAGGSTSSSTTSSTVTTATSSSSTVESTSSTLSTTSSSYPPSSTTSSSSSTESSSSTIISTSSSSTTLSATPVTTSTTLSTITTTSSTTTTTTTTSTTTTTTSIPVPTALSCTGAALPYKTFSDGTDDWEIRCGVDYPPNDLTANNSPTFEACIASCKDLPACVAVTWITSGPTPALAAQGSASCYLKSAIGAVRGPNQPWNGPPLTTAILKNPFKILNVMYSNLDITVPATANWIQGNNIVINTNTWWNLKGDPWQGLPKSGTILYTFKGQTRMWVGIDNSGIFTITPGLVSNHVGSSVVPTWAASTTVTDIKIIGASWGRGPVTQAPSITKMYASYAVRALWKWETPNMVVSYDNDNWSGVSKSGIIYYRNTKTGALMYIAGREWDNGVWARPA